MSISLSLSLYIYIYTHIHIYFSNSDSRQRFTAAIRGSDTHRCLDSLDGVRRC